MRGRRTAVAALSLFLVGAGTSCSRKEASPRAITPVAVAPFAPLAGLAVVEEDGVEARLDRVGDDSLIGAARLWRLERDGTVVGALQVATWKEKAENADAERRATVDAAVHAGRTRTEAAPGGEVKVSSRIARKGDRRPGLVRATWFTGSGFAVLTLRDDIDRAPVLASLVEATLNPSTKRRIS